MTRQVVVVLVLVNLSIAAHASQTSTPLVERLRLQPTSETVTLRFAEEVSLKEVFEELSKQTGVTLLFDEAFQDQRTHVNIGTVSVDDGLSRLTTIHRLFYKILDPTSVLIIPDNAQKHRQYDEMLLHTFTVEHSDVNTVANMFRTLAGIQRVQPDLVHDTVTVRATADQLLVAEGILERNDVRPGEVTLQLNILALDSDFPSLADGAITPERLTELKNSGHAEVFLSPVIRLADNDSGSLAVEEGAQGPVARAPDTGEATESESPRAVGLRLSFRPQIRREDSVQLAVALEATARASDSSPQEGTRRFRDLTTTLSMDPGLVALIPAMFRVDEFGTALPGTEPGEDSRLVFLAISLSDVRYGEAPTNLPPLRMGTEQWVQVP